MARVIKPGPPRREVEKRVDCPHCGARIGYVGNDVHQSNGKDYGGGPDGREWVDCPQCGKDITIRSW